jgi:LemA protein
MPNALVVLIFLAVVLGLPSIWLIANHNRFVRLRQHIRESWADIDVELKRRYELIPNLVATVNGYAAHEQDVLARVTELRNRAAASTGSPATQAADESALLLGLRQLFVVAERYPQLRADAQFLALQQELANTEDRIAAARRFFNANVRELNQLCESFPTSVIADVFGFTPQTYFELESAAERVVPRVQA